MKIKMIVAAYILVIPLAEAIAATDSCYEYTQRKEYDRAIDTCSSDIDSGKYSGSNLAYTYFYRGGAYFYKGDYDQAISDFNRAIELDSKHASAYYNRGLGYGRKGDYDRAISDFNRAIELNPKYALAYCNRGAAYGRKGNYGRAISDYSKALELNPKDAYPYNKRGNDYYDKGDYERAIADYNKAIELDPKYEYTRIRLLLTLRKVSKERANSYLQEFKTYVNSNSQSSWVRSISKYYLKMDDLTEKGVLEEARRGKDDQEVRGQLCEAYYYLGEEQLWKGNRKGAKEYFQKSVMTNLYGFVEYQAAKAELKKMNVRFIR